MTTAFVVNPAARGCPAGFADGLRRRYPDAAVRTTAGPGDGAALAARALAEGAEVVVACGGDGTFREVATAVGDRASLGFVPLGTVNQLASELGLPKDAEGALAVVASGAPRPLFGGRCRADGEEESRLFFLGASAGPDADAVHAVGREKRHLGRYAYALRFAARMLRPVAADVKCRWDTGRRPFGQVVVLRAPHYGGRYRMSERLALGEPGLEVVGVGAGRLPVLRLFLDALRSRVRDRAGLTRQPAREVRLTLPPPGRCQLDGDPLLARELTLWADPAPLRVLAPN